MKNDKARSLKPTNSMFFEDIPSEQAALMAGGVRLKESDFEDIVIIDDVPWLDMTNMQFN